MDRHAGRPRSRPGRGGGARGGLELIDRVDVLGVRVSAVTLDSAVAEIGRWIEAGEQQYVCVTGVHGVIESQRDPELLRIHNASGMTTPDGMPMVWAGRSAGANISRVYGPDLMIATCEASLEHGWKHFLYGGRDGVPKLLAERLRARFPGLQIVGTISPPFRPVTEDEDAEIVRAIDASGADIVWVGLSTPKQERWMAAHHRRIAPAVMVGVGAAFDIHAGTLPQAPLWMQRNGLEWLYRLLREPRRLWRRYAVIVPTFIVRIVRNRPRLVRPT